LKTVFTYFYILFVLFALIQIDLIAQIPQFKNIRVLKGKNNYIVKTIYQDNTGYIWFGTNLGLVRFDGVNNTFFNLKDSLADIQITALCCDKQNQLWVGHKNGKISLYKKNLGFNKFNPAEGIGDKEISSIITDNSGTIWFSTLGEGIYYYKNNRLYNVNKDEGLIDNFCYCLALDNKQNIWIGTDAGISIYSLTDKKIKNISMKDGLPDNIVKSIVFAKDGNAWIGMEEGGVCSYNPGKKIFSPLSNWKFGPVSSMTMSDAQNIWVAAPNAGLVNINLDLQLVNYRIYTTADGLIDNKTQCVYSDIEHNVWAGSRNGATLCPGDLFTFLSEKHDDHFKNIFFQLKDRQNNIWFCTQSGLFIAKIDEMSRWKVEKVFKNKLLDSYNFISLYQAKDNTIWAGTYGKGVLKINPDTYQYKEYNTKNGLVDDNVISITGNTDFLVFTTLGKGISILEYSQPDRFINYSVENGLKSNYVYSAFIDNKNQIWLAQDGSGVSLIKDFKIIQLPKLNEIKNTIYAFAQDAKKNIWMLTSDEGIFKFDGENISKLNVSKGLSSDNNQAIIIDEYNNLLIISNDGIDIVNPETNAVHSYTEENEVAYLEPSLNAVNKDNTGDIWIGTAKGIVRYNPHFFNSNKKEPYITIARKRVQFNDISDEKKTFSYDENNFVIDYIGFWYKAPDKLVYRYKLDGHDNNWHIETKSLTAAYSNLADGKYVFKVEVSYIQNQWISSPNAEFSFRIKPPFWKTWWFIVSCVIIVVASFYFFLKYRIASLQKAKELLENEVLKRTAVIKKQMEEIETQLEQIAIKNRSITDSINYARRIQDAIFPPIELINKFLPESFVLFKPKDIVSGDFYWIAEKDQWLIIAVADCTGHGVPGAFMSMLGITLLNEIVNKHEINSASTILDLLRQNVISALRQTGDKDKTKDGMDISLCVIEKNLASLQYAGAYNSLYLIRNNQLSEYKADRMPIGIHINAKENFTNNKIDILKNDLFYLFSDGYSDQIGGEKLRKFQSLNFKNLLVEISNLSPTEQKENLENTLEKYRGKHEQVDDVMVLGFKI